MDGSTSDMRASFDVEAGSPVYQIGELTTLTRCANPTCLTPYVARTKAQRTCGKASCREALRVVTPARRDAAKARNRAWSEQNRGVKGTQPMLLGAPTFDIYLPGGGMEIAISPVPQWRIEHRNIRALHGMITTMIDEPHDPLIPGFALVPWPTGCGWGVYVRDAAQADRLANKRHSARIFDRDVEVRFSTVRKIKAPVVTKRGRARLRIDAITPVCIRNGGGSTTYTAPTTQSLWSAITNSFLPRVGVHDLDPQTAMLRLVEATTQPETVQLGGKFHGIRGWTGHVIVEGNAVARWLVQCAGLVGLGGRTALGFGRVRVTEVP